MSLAAIDPAAQSRGASARLHLTGGAGLLALWAGASALFLLVVALLPGPIYDADDLMRLQQVRDLLAGQAWFDVTQYRMEPPAGAAMHWSRLVDIPLAAAILLFRLVLPAAAAEYTATLVVPLLYLGGALWCLRAIMLRLGIKARSALLGLGLLALYPMVPPGFAPMRIDHHAAQAVAALVCACLFLGTPSSRAAMLAGVAMAAWLVISLEGLPVAALVAGLYGLRYILERDRSLAWFLLSLAGTSLALSLATRPASEFAQWCDILLPIHSAAFAMGAGGAWLAARMPAQDRAVGRVAALGLVPLACLPGLIMLMGQCSANPFGTLDPLVQTYWYDSVGEAYPVWKQPLDVALAGVFTALLVPAGLWAARETGLVEQDRRHGWSLYALLTLGLCAYGLLLQREMLVAQLLSLPFAVALAGWLLPRIRAMRAMVPRVFATVAALLVVTPAGAAIVGRQLESATPVAESGNREAGSATLAPCEFRALDRLPAGTIFTSFNSAPTILANTRHSVTVGGYHRNAAALRREIAAFTGDAVQAREEVAAARAHYLAVCLDDSVLDTFAQGRPTSLAAQIVADKAPDWLIPVTDFSGSRLRVYRVTPDGNPSPRR